ncbi:YciI family protein [Arsenicitalea aurantiaca]|uniref:YciI family protein n=1 Tax=Arsenicitalea aurantiaca TaxID=1783274 RepID=A0A433X433_9HYPH|nr:YciI family protein [Arsenicitalea aurantiaca]RUT28825.1 YciI family protein [Arsenicitalea aurantiaca]
MLYAILCYNSEDAVGSWSKAEDDRVMAQLGAVEDGLAQKGKLGPVARLMNTTAATTLRKSGNEQIVLDGPFAETKEQFLGFFVLDCESLEDAIAATRELAIANPGGGAYEIRPLRIFKPAPEGFRGKALG